MAKYRTDVATQVMRVVENNRLPDAIKTGISRALLQEGELVENVMEELVGSLGVRAERLYAYAQKGKYYFGLPSGQFTNPGESLQNTLINVLSDVYGTTSLELVYVHHGVPNLTHIGWVRLIQEHGYDPATNKIGRLSTDPAAPVYLDDMVVVVPAADAATTDPASIEQWGTSPKAGYTPERGDMTQSAASLVPHTPVLFDPAATTEHLQVKTYQRQTNGTVVRSEFVIPVSGFSEMLDYFQVKYVTGGITRYFMYEDGEGTYPALDGIYSKNYQGPGSFFPFLYFRHNKQSVIGDKTSPEYKSSKRFSKLLGLDYDAVAQGIDSNPDIKDVEQAVMMFAVPANTSDSAEQRYLWEFFNSLYLSQPTRLQSSSATVSNLRLRFSEPAVQNLGLLSPDIVIQDSRFKMTLRNSGIYKRSVGGKIGPVGAHNFELVDLRKHIYRRQISAAIYEEIEVVDMQTVFRIFEEWSVTADEDDKILLVPLDHAITRKLNMADREQLYSRSLHYVFNSRVVTKLKWYQTGLFKVLTVVIAIAMTIYSGGTAAEALVAALSTGAITAAAVILLEMVLTTLIYRQIFKLFVKVAGVKLAFIAAIVAAVVGISTFADGISVAGAPLAQELLIAASGITQAIGAQVGQDMQGLQNDYLALLKEQEKATKLLESAQELLDGNVRLNPFVIFGEAPQDYYNRTVHSGNIGVVGIDAVSSFVDIKLTLPKLSDTLGIEGEMNE